MYRQCDQTHRLLKIEILKVPVKVIKAFLMSTLKVIFPKDIVKTQEKEVCLSPLMFMSKSSQNNMSQTSEAASPRISSLPRPY